MLALIQRSNNSDDNFFLILNSWWKLSSWIFYHQCSVSFKNTRTSCSSCDCVWLYDCMYDCVCECVCLLNPSQLLSYTLISLSRAHLELMFLLSSLVFTFQWNFQLLSISVILPVHGVSKLYHVNMFVMVCHLPGIVADNYNMQIIPRLGLSSHHLITMNYSCSKFKYS